jgi:hypothetical protein
MKPRRVIAVYPLGDTVFVPSYPLTYMAHTDQINLTGVPNANAAMPLMLHIQQQCELGCWHTIDKMEIPPYGND